MDMTQSTAEATFSRTRLSEWEVEIAELLEISDSPGKWRPDVLISRDLLYRLSDGGSITYQEDLLELIWTEWTPGLLDAMEWWHHVGWTALKQLFEGKADKYDIERRLAEIAILQSNVFHALSKGRQQWLMDVMPGLEGESSDELALELAKRYGLFTKYMDALVLEAFPDLSRKRLLDPYPEWGHNAHDHRLSDADIERLVQAAQCYSRPK